jgi:maltooligosyltrehalose trehalohydrolase
MALDGVWADDFHHQMRRRLAGDRDGYFADFSGSTADIVDTVTHGFHYRGRVVARTGRPRGSDTTGIPRHRFVFCIQNHDQIGNRALGERLHHQIDPAAYRAAAALLLLAPETPLLFMGQEWAASSPFLYFTDHHPELGKLVTRGRREEFKGFAAFSSPDARERIPDPQSETTFVRSRLRWEEAAREPHAQVLNLYRALLELRRRIGPPALAELRAQAHEPAAVVLTSPAWLIVAALEGAATVGLPSEPGPDELEVVLDTEEPRFAAAARRPALRRDGDAISVAFSRPGALVLRRPTRKEHP